MTDPTDVCRHGGLRRKCEPCDLAQEVKELRAELDALKRTREQEKDYADTCYENERLRAALDEIVLKSPGDNWWSRDVARSALNASPNEPPATQAPECTCKSCPVHGIPKYMTAALPERTDDGQ